MNIPDPYAELHIEHTATTAEIGRAYRRLMRQYHPDTRLNAHGDQDRGSADRSLRLIMDAYSLLADPVLRAEYDRQHWQANVDNDRTTSADDGCDQHEVAGPGPAPGSHIYVEAVSSRDTVWLFPPAAHLRRDRHPVRVIYYLGVTQ